MPNVDRATGAVHKGCPTCAHFVEARRIRLGDLPEECLEGVREPQEDTGALPQHDECGRWRPRQDLEDQQVKRELDRVTLRQRRVAIPLSIFATVFSCASLCLSLSRWYKEGTLERRLSGVESQVHRATGESASSSLGGHALSAPPPPPPGRSPEDEAAESPAHRAPLLPNVRKTSPTVTSHSPTTKAVGSERF